MTKIRIQKTSNGNFCTAAQWAEDLIAERKAGRIMYRYLEIPAIDDRFESASQTLATMREKYPRVTAALKTTIMCRLASNGGTSDYPHIEVYGTYFTVYAVTWAGTPEENYAACDAALLATIAAQQKIVDMHNATEI
jgi:hypothetical protein